MGQEDAKVGNLLGAAVIGDLDEQQNLLPMLTGKC